MSKLTLIVMYSRDGGLPDDIPFDIQVQRILPYGTADSLRAHSKAQLPVVGSSSDPPMTQA